MRKDYIFETTCVDSTYELIRQMQEDAIDVTYETMLKHCDGMLNIAEEIGYVRASHVDHGLTLKNDWHVSYHKSYYDDVPCYFFVWSHIEHIWTRKKQI